MPMSWKNAALASAAAVLLGASRPGTSAATPSTNFWAPSTPYVQPFRVLHLTYDSYFHSAASYPIDVGATLGVLPWKQFQAEVGFDLFYASVASDGAVDFPVVLNGKVGAPEDVYFKGQPAWSFGIFGAGFEKDYNDQNVLYGVLGKTLPRVGFASVGGYYALNEDLFRSVDGDVERSGLLAGWASPAIDVPNIDKIMLTWDVQTGHNVLGATGGGLYLYFTPAIDLLTGPVFFFEKELQPGGASWMWSVQLDVDIDFLSGGQ